MLRRPFILPAFFLAVSIPSLCSALAAPAANDPAAVEQRIQELQPTADERRLDQIGWAKDIREARRLAQENNRPVLLFTLDGQMGTGRC